MGIFLKKKQHKKVYFPFRRYLPNIFLEVFFNFVKNTIRKNYPPEGYLCQKGGYCYGIKNWGQKITPWGYPVKIWAGKYPPQLN